MPTSCGDKDVIKACISFGDLGLADLDADLIFDVVEIVNDCVVCEEVLFGRDDEIGDLEVEFIFIILVANDLIDVIGFVAVFVLELGIVPICEDNGEAGSTGGVGLANELLYSSDVL